jgi:hypothetical protein
MWMSAKMSDYSNRVDAIKVILTILGVSRVGLCITLGYSDSESPCPLLKWEYFGPYGEEIFHQRLVQLLRERNILATPILRHVFPEVFPQARPPVNQAPAVNPAPPANPAPAHVGVFRLVPLAADDAPSAVTNECIICLEPLSANNRYAFIPCGHSRTCYECLSTMQKRCCHECRQPVTGLLKLYL